MASLYPPASVADLTSLDVRVTGPDTELADGDLRRLFPGSSLTGVRLDRLREWPRVVVTLGGDIVAVATCKKTEGEMRVPDIGLDIPAMEAGYAAVYRCSERDILNTLLDGIELASVAGGCRRVIVSPPRVSLAFLERRGYVRVNERCAGGWIEKSLA
ncbi:MAG TPA: hypothetical protein VF147_09690 [Vicinamibacterales bacterium]